MSRPSHPLPADGLLSWWVVLSIAVMVVNDHWAKEAFGSWWTGKLSDFAVMLFFPLMLQALVEVVQRLLGRYQGPSGRVLLGSLFFCLVGFSAINLFEPAAHLYRVVWGGFHWAQDLVPALVSGQGLPSFGLASFWLDPTDCITLVSLVPAWLLGRRRTPRAPNPAGTSLLFRSILPPRRPQP